MMIVLIILNLIRMNFSFSEGICIVDDKAREEP
jgi:hypothetical protein